jgi:hypothetical protein
MENPIDNYILGGAVPVSTGFGDYGDTNILNQINEEGKPIIIEDNVFTPVIDNPENTTPIPTPTPTPTNTDTESGTKLNKPTQNFMSNAYPFLIGIGIVVGLVFLGDFFKSKSE